MGLVLLLGGFVTVELPLNPAEAIGSGADQVSLDVVQFVLIRFQLGLGQVDLLLQAGPGRARSLGAGDLFLQLVNPLLIGFDRRRSLIGLGVELFALGGRRSGVLRGLAHFIAECDIHGMARPV